MTDSRFRQVRDHLATGALAISLASAALLAYGIRTLNIFDNPDQHKVLLGSVWIGFVVSIGLALIGLPRLQAFVAFFVVTVAGVIYISLPIPPGVLQ